MCACVKFIYTHIGCTNIRMQENTMHKHEHRHTHKHMETPAFSYTFAHARAYTCAHTNTDVNFI